MAAEIIRPLPQDVDTERAILGAILVNNELIHQVTDKLSPDDFFLESHQQIFSRMLALYQRSEPVDEITLKSALDAIGYREKISLSFLSQLTDGVPRLNNVAPYAEILRKKSLLRKLIEASHAITEMGYAEDEDVKDVLKRAETSIFDIAQSFIKKNYVPLSEALFDAYEYLCKHYEAKTYLTGISSGYNELDQFTCGLQRGDLILLAARPSMGKTTLAVNIAMNMALGEKATVAIFSLEMSSRQLALRVLSSDARIDHQKIRSGYFSPSDLEKIGKSLARLSQARVFIDDTAGLSVLELQSKARRLKREHGLDMILIDYLQLMSSGSSRRNDNRVQEIAEISRSLKALAKDLDVPVLALSQLSRQTESRKGDHRPMLSDLRESGSLEQDADVVLFIYRAEMYDRDNPDLENKAEVIIAKQRNGPTETVHLAFLKEFSRFENLAYRSSTES